MRSKKIRITTGSPFETEIGYSRAIVQGDWCFVSGVTGYDYETMTMPEAAGDPARNCFATIENVLEEAAFEMTDIVRVQYTLADRALLADVQPELKAGLGDVRPAATMVIADLIAPEMKN